MENDLQIDTLDYIICENHVGIKRQHLKTK